MTIKIYLTGKHTSQAANANKYPFGIAVFQGIHALILMLPLFWVLGYIDISSIQFNLPIIVRIIAIICYTLLIIAMVWQMQSLSINIAANHEDRYLVTSGPYRYVRHPLYLIFILVPILGGLIATNWVFLLATIPSYISSKVRADYEEELLLKEYGDEYTDYNEQTGQLIPVKYL